MNLTGLTKRFNLRGMALSVKAWVYLIVSLIVLIIIYYVLLDQYTPYTNDAYIQAYVVQIAPQVEGPVTKVYVKNDTFVKTGQPLFEIDYRPYEYKVKQLEAKLVKTRQDIMQLESEIRAAEAVAVQSEADFIYAKRRFEDLLPLAKKQFIPQLQLDQARDDLNAKRALVHKAEADLARARQALELKIDGDYAIIKEAESDLALAKYYLSQTRVYAPIDGYITNLQLILGSYVKVGEAVITLVDAGNWWIIANFQENSLERIRPGQAAELSIATYPGKIFKGKVESIYWGVSTGQGIPSGDLPDVQNPGNWVKLAQRFPVRLTLLNLDSTYPLRIGGSVSVAVFTEKGLILNSLAKLWLRIGSYVNYIY
ncbi:MAG: Multidrug resistance efflux pump [Candidatus Dadabacteria bacterium CSP1-2]|nr:MAG: Multidrug resistance efflux pump [Candidatus Dadabacteria bacterium CSP1-2]